jgi:hypothetical protein
MNKLMKGINKLKEKGKMKYINKDRRKLNKQEVLGRTYPSTFLTLSNKSEIIYKGITLHKIT